MLGLKFCVNCMCNSFAILRLCVLFKRLLLTPRDFALLIWRDRVRNRRA